MDSTKIYNAVLSGYSAASKGSTDSDYASRVAESFGYTKDELDSIPKDANLGLSCGNPLVVAGLKEGEVVVDLGCGAGFDVFLAAQKVGSTGKAIGVDMNDDMLWKANLNKSKASAQNVEFVKAALTDLSPLQDSSADCVISNCVVNLVPEDEKQLAFNEMGRVLKSGGRVAISDILLKKELTQELKGDMGLYVACIAGASMVEGYERYLKEAGFTNILITMTGKDLNVYKDLCGDGETASCCGKPQTASEADEMNGASKAGLVNGRARDVDFNKYAGAYNIYAIKG